MKTAVKPIIIEAAVDKPKSKRKLWSSIDFLVVIIETQLTVLSRISGLFGSFEIPCIYRKFSENSIEK